MATLTGELISETYDSLLKVTDNNTITGIKKRITDGFGNDIPLLLSSTDLEIDGTLILSALTDLVPATKFLSLKADNSVGFRTASELLSDIGGASSASISGTTGRLSKFTSTGAVGNSILDEIGNVIHLTDGTSSYASFGINNPGVDNDAYIGSTINNDFLIKINNVEALRIDTALRLKIANIQNALEDTDKFLVSEDGVVKYRTGTELRSDIGAGTGSVTSVGLTMPVAFSVANSPITSAGTLEVTAVGTASQYIRGDGQLATLPTGAGGGSAVNYYLNGSIASSVAGYQQMDNTAIIGAGTDFTLTGNGLIAQFLTDIDNPNRLLIPGGAWNLEMFFQISSSGGNAKFYVDLFKYDGTTFTSIASGVTNPEEITGGTSIDLYLTSLAVPETALLITDRLAIQVYIVDNSGGRTVTLHTEDNTLCQVTTTFAGGISALNGLTANTQYFAVGTSGTDFNISSLTDTHTFNLPSASATNRGALSSDNWSTFNNKIGGSGTTNYIPKFSGANSLINSIIYEDATGVAIGVPFSDPSFLLYVNGGIKANGNSTINGDLTASKFIVPGGTSSQFLKADGSKDANSYALASALSDLVTLSTTQTITGEKTFTAGNIFIDSRSYFAEDNGQSGQAGYTQMITLADSFSFINGATTKSALFAYGGGVRSYILPSSNGTLALTSDLSAYLPLTGGTLTGVLTLNSGVGSNPNFASTTNGLEITSDGSTASNRNIIFKIASTTALSIDNSTNVAIGYTTNPSLYKLDVNGTGRFKAAQNTQIYLEANGEVSPSIAFVTTNGTNYIQSDYTTSALKLLTNAAGVTALSLAYTTGAATFSSSVTSGALLTNGASGAAGQEALRINNNNGYIGFFNSANTTRSGYIQGNTTDVTINTNGSNPILLNTSGGNVGIGVTPASVSKLQVKVATDVNFSIRNAVDVSGAVVIQGITDIAGDNIPLEYRATKHCFSVGNVGIGTTTPSSKLTISGTSANTESGQIRIINPGANEQTFQIGYNTTSDYAYLNAYKAGIGYKPISLNPDGGNVLIGTSTDLGQKLRVNGNIVSDGPAGTNILLSRDNATGLMFGWFNNGAGSYTLTNFAVANVASINMTTGVYTAISDVNKKKDFEQSQIGLNAILGLKPTLYRMKTDANNSDKHLGFIAQEVKEFIPQAYSESGEGENKFIGLTEMPIIATLVKAIQELNEKIIQLENK